MPPLETTDRWQDAILWTKVGTDRYGQPTVSAALEIKVRWQRKLDLKAAQSTEAVALDAQVVVDRDVGTGGLLYLGPLEDWTGSGSPSGSGTLYRVVTFDKVPDIKARNFRRVAGLQRYKDKLPTVV